MNDLKMPLTQSEVTNLKELFDVKHKGRAYVAIVDIEEMPEGSDGFALYVIIYDIKARRALDVRLSDDMDDAAAKAFTIARGMKEGQCEPVVVIDNEGWVDATDATAINCLNEDSRNAI